MIALIKLSHSALTKMLLFILILLDDTTPLRWIAKLALHHTPQGAAAHNQIFTLLTQRYETWLNDPPSYDELRLAVRILGLRVTVLPTTGEWPYRYDISVTLSEIMKRLD
jgi:hypothetical protein